jgi:predicted N-formylglutamate amidohydrolase
MDSAGALLAADEPAAFTLVNAEGGSGVFLVCDHASRRIPRALGSLGLDEPELSQHIAWDIGAAEVAQGLSALLDAPLLRQNWSRLVIDCNRPPQAQDSVPAVSAGIRIPGNAGIGDTERGRRRREIFDPYQSRLRHELNRRAAARRLTVLVSIHSFTPHYLGVDRPWHCGLMSHRDRRFAEALLPLLRQEPGLCVGDNEPYAMGDHSDYTLPVHGEGRGIAHVGIEIRQDLVADQVGQRDWAQRLARLLPAAIATAIP